MEAPQIVQDVPDAKERLDAGYSFIRVAENFKTSSPEAKTIIMGIAAVVGMLINLQRQEGE